MQYPPQSTLGQLLTQYAVIIPDSSLFHQIPAGMHIAEHSEVRRTVQLLIGQLDNLDALLKHKRVNLSAEARVRFLRAREHHCEYAQENGKLWQPYAERLDAFQMPEAAFFSAEYNEVYHGFKRLLKFFERASGIALDNREGAAYAALFSLVDPTEPQIFLTRNTAQHRLLAMLFEFVYSGEIARNEPCAGNEMTIERMLHSPQLYVGEPDMILQEVSPRMSTVAGHARTVTCGMAFDYAKHGLRIGPEGKKLFRDAVYGMLAGGIIKPRHWIDRAKDGHTFSEDSYIGAKHRAEESYRGVKLASVELRSAFKRGVLPSRIQDILEVRDSVEEVPEILALMDQNLGAIRTYVSAQFEEEKYNDRALLEKLAKKSSRDGIVRGLSRLRQIADAANLLDGTGDDQNAMHQLSLDVHQQIGWVEAELSKYGNAPRNKKRARKESIGDLVRDVEDIAAVAPTIAAQSSLDKVRQGWVQIIYDNLGHWRKSPVDEGTAISKMQLAVATTYTYGGLLAILRKIGSSHWPRGARTRPLTREFIERIVWHMQYAPTPRRR